MAKKELDQSEREIGLGTLHGKNSMFLRVAAGNASSGDLKYELSHSLNGAPMVRSEQTGRTFTFNWQKLIAYAVHTGGIDREDEAEQALAQTVIDIAIEAMKDKLRAMEYADHQHYTDDERAAYRVLLENAQSITI